MLKLNPLAILEGEFGEKDKAMWTGSSQTGLVSLNKGPGTAKDIVYEQESGPHQTLSPQVPWSWASQTPELCYINFCDFISYSACGILTAHG